MRSLRVPFGWLWLIPLGMVVFLVGLAPRGTIAQDVVFVDVEGQPFAANVQRLLQGARFPRNATVSTYPFAGRYRGPECKAATTTARLPCSLCGDVEPGISRHRGPRSSSGHLAAGRLYSRSAQGHQRERGHAGTPHLQPSIGSCLCRCGRPEHETPGPGAPETERKCSQRQGPVPARGNVHQPAHDREPERPAGRVRPGPHLQQRSRTA